MPEQLTSGAPTVSVVIAAYNHAPYVQGSIRSIIAQTYQDIELLVLDDGSKDETWEKIRELRPECEARFSRVDFSTQQNQGTCKTLNTLLAKARGRYVYVLDSDDLAAPHAIETECAFLDKHEDYALCVGDCAIIDGQGAECYWDSNQQNVYDRRDARWTSMGDWISKTHANLDMPGADFGSYLHLLTFSNHVPNGYLIRRSVFEKTGPFLPEAPLEDYWLMLQIAKHAKMKYIPEVLAYYRSHSTNTIRNAERMRINSFKVYMRELEELGDSMPMRVISYLEGELARATGSRTWRFGRKVARLVRLVFPVNAVHTKALGGLLRLLLRPARILRQRLHG